MFNNIKWPTEKVHQEVWESMMDYDKIEWHKMLQGLAKAPNVVYDDTFINLILCRV